MMFERLEKKLAALGAAGWELSEETVTGWEFYFIRHALDQNRAVETRNYTVKLYADVEGGFLGSASGQISPTASEEEIDKALADILFQAGLVKNPAYTLTDAPVPQEEGEEVCVEKIAEDFLRAMDSVHETETEDVNSYEIFVKSVTRRFKNSNGVSYTRRFPSSLMEVVVNARREGHEIELYRLYPSGTCDADRLRSDVEDVMRVGKDRLHAVPTPVLKDIPVLFPNENAIEIYDYFRDHMSAGAKVRRVSTWESGKPIAEDMTGDVITMKAVAKLPNSSHSYDVDEEGSEIRDRYLIKDGVAQNFWGSRQMSQYLGLEGSSLVYNVVVDGGKQSAADLRTGDYLEVIEFSDFQVDSMAGDIAGEIRLAYWHHDGECTPVTGGSVSGSMMDAMRTMRFSSETVQYDTHVIPRETVLYGLRITGVE